MDNNGKRTDIDQIFKFKILLLIEQITIENCLLIQ